MPPEADASRAKTFLAAALLTAAVTALHLVLVGQVLPDRLGAGAADAADAADAAERMAVSFVSELAPAAPAPAPSPALRRPDVAAPSAAPARTAAEVALAAAAAASAASAVPPVEPESARVAEVAPPVLAAASASAAAVLEAPASAHVAASAEAIASAPAGATAQAFDWPPSTRLSYRLSGHFRGPVEGQAQVEWLRSGTRYQVHLDIGVGPSFAPLLARRISSEGEITADGLKPLRYDEETRVLFRQPRQLQIDMGAETVRLPLPAGGQAVARPAGLQDSASQFVQLTWLFTTRPELLQAGQSIALPLALPRRIQLWHYEVGNSETLDTPAGPVQAVHVVPRGEVANAARRGGDLVVEAWFAPSLQYLPVRILIRQEGDNYVDLLLERLPQQAERGR